jgi:undecaprenyl-diphosphatase
MLRGLAGRDGRGAWLFLLLVVAFLPAAVLGPLLDDYLEARLFRPGPVIAMLFLGGVALLAIKPWQDRLRKRQAEGGHPFVAIEDLRLRDAALIGLMQCVAMIPGTSRSMMSILGGLAVGLSPARAAEFSFLLGLPTLGGACVYKLLKELRSNGLDFVEPMGGWGPVIVGIVVAAISAAIAVKWLVGYLERHSFAVFGWWRIGVAAAIAAMIWGGASLT